MAPTMKPKPVCLQLTSDLSVRVRHHIRNGEQVQFQRTEQIRFRSAYNFSVLLTPASPFVGDENPISAKPHENEFWVEATFRPEEAGDAPVYTAAISLTPTAAEPRTVAAALPVAAALSQVEIIIEQF